MIKVKKTLYTEYCDSNTEVAEEYFRGGVFWESEDTKYWDSSETIIITEVIEGQLHRIEVLEES